MTAPSIAGFFSGGSASVSWKDAPIGTTVSGVISRVNEAEPQTDIKTGEPVVVKGRTKMQIRIELANTNLRNPQDPDDDGSRTLYVKGWMQGAIGDALRKAGVATPEIGGTLTVVHTEQTPSDTPGFDPIKKFAATYAPPAAMATQEFFQAPTGTPVPPRVAAQIPVVPPVAVEPEPARPEAISEAAWALMPLETKKAVAGIPF